MVLRADSHVLETESLIVNGPGSWIRLLLSVGLVAGLAALAVSWWAAVDHTSPVPFSAGVPPSDFPVDLQPVTFTATDGILLSGWHGRADPERGLVILLHPFRAGRWLMLDRARGYAKRGYSVLLYDARATGESEGDRISVGWHETHDLRGALRWANQQGHERILLHGISQGGATILLAADHLGEAVTAIIVESTYDTLLNAGDRRFRNKVRLPGWLAGLFYRPFMEIRLGFTLGDASPIDFIGSIHAPLFILSGELDQHTLAEDTRRLHAAAPPNTPLWIVPGAAHVDLYAHAPTDFEQQLDDFLRRVEDD